MKVLLGAALAISLTGAAVAQGVGLPGDRVMGGGGGGGQGGMAGGMMGGPAAPRPAMPPAQRPPDPVAVTPSIDVAMKAARAIAAACKQYPMALAVVDAEGVAKLIYVPDGSAPWHGYSAVRKAYTAITFKADSSQVIKQLAQDPAMMDKFKADTNLVRQSGGLVLMAGGKIVGGIGVSGAEPGGHDEECGLVGREAIKNDLK